MPSLLGRDSSGTTRATTLHIVATGSKSVSSVAADPALKIRHSRTEELVCPSKYYRCVNERFSALGIFVCAVTVSTNLALIILGEQGWLPSYDYNLFGFSYPLVWSICVATIGHRCYALRQYHTSGALERLRDVPLPDTDHAINAKVVKFSSWVLGPVFGSIAMFQGPVYALLLFRRVEFDWISAFYSFFIVTCALQGFMLFNYCAVYDNLFCWSIPMYTISHIDNCLKKIEKLLKMQEQSKERRGDSPAVSNARQINADAWSNDMDESVMSTGNGDGNGNSNADDRIILRAVDDAVHGLLKIVREQHELLGTHQSLVSIVQSACSVLIIPQAMKNFADASVSGDMMVAACGWIMIAWGGALLGLEVVQMNAAAMVNEHWTQKIIDFNRLRYSQIEVRLFGRRGEVYALLRAMSEHMNFPICGVPINSTKLGNVMEALKFALYLAMLTYVLKIS